MTHAPPTAPSAMMGASGDRARGADWQRARALVLAHGWNAAAYQILNPGMRHWFAADGDAVIGWARHAGVRVVAGAPVCSEARLPEVAEAFERDARAAGDEVCYFGAGARLERAIGERLGERAAHALVPLGAQPVWDPRRWDAVVRGKASLRAQLSRATNKGVRVREWTPADAERSDALRAVLRAWLDTRGLPPLHFMVEPDTLDCLGDRRVFVAERAGGDAAPEVLAFLVATPVPARHGWLVEQWPRRPQSPNGTTHLLVNAAMRAAGDAGSPYVTLGLSPLSRHAPAPPTATPALWVRVTLAWIRAHGHRFYNFAGLDDFKASLRPEGWEPIYAIAAGGRVTPRLLYAIAGVFGAGSPVGLVGRALAMAARREAAEVRRRMQRRAGG